MTRREAREQALCLVFEHAFQQETLPEMLISAAEAREDFHPSPFAERLAGGVFDHEEAIDQKIEQYAKGWSKDRLSRVALTVLRIAFYELLFSRETPESVAINEAVELAKKFGDKGDGAYVNGVLGAYMRAEKADVK